MNREEHLRELWRQASRRYRINHKERIRKERQEKYQENKLHNRKVRKFWYYKEKEIEKALTEQRKELGDYLALNESTRIANEKLRQELRQQAKREVEKIGD